MKNEERRGGQGASLDWSEAERRAAKRPVDQAETEGKRASVLAASELDRPEERRGGQSGEIERLRYELERYRKKVDDQEKQIAELTGRCEMADRGNRETHMAANALQAALALEYGENAVDPDEPEKLLGKRLTLPAYQITDMLRRYEVRAGKDRDGNYVIGVCSKGETSS